MSQAVSLTGSTEDPPRSASPSTSQVRKTRTSLLQTPSRLRTPSRPTALVTAQGTHSTPEVPTQRAISASGLPAPKNVIRKTVSIGSFPQPPSSSRPGTASGLASPTSPRKRLSDVNRISTQATRTKKTPRLSSGSSYQRSETPSLLNGSGEDALVGNKRSSDSSAQSPLRSRSSSPNGSYSTSATTLEEVDEERGRTRPEADQLDSPRSQKKEHKGNVTVSVRVRPDASHHDPAASEGEWMVDGRRALIAYRGKEGSDYTYDNVFGTYDDNARVYDSAAKRLVRRVMEGYHGTVFAYGMTGTGKTFSMQGTINSPGVIPLAITDIFSYIRETPQREFLLRVSYLEIYNEKINDLLAPLTGSGAAQEEIKLREDPVRGVYATPLKEEIVQSPTQLLRVIHRGDMSRRTGSTQWNARSSRSHAVVQIVVESRERIALGHESESKRSGMAGGVRVSTLSLIDLAGSERAAEDRERRTEGAHINKSLLTLGTVISKLSNKDKNGNPVEKDSKHLPYRDSKLTRLLQPALSGSSLISILCTIQIGSNNTSATANTHTAETINTLKFAARAKNNIVSHAKKAVEEVGTGGSAGLLEHYRSEIARLRTELEDQKKGGSESTKEEAKEEMKQEKEQEHRHEEQMLEMQLARTALKERIEHLNRLILCSKSTGVNSGITGATGMHGRMSGGTLTDFGGPRSVRSSASHSTLGTFGPTISRHHSMASVGPGRSSFSPVMDDEEDHGEYGDGMASLQAQNRALQADLQDKNRYITTLEKRLLQARRSSHSRTSMAFSRSTTSEPDLQRQLEEKDTTIADLQKTVTALRSAMRQRSVAELTPDSSSGEFRSKKDLRVRIEDSEDAESMGPPLQPESMKPLSPPPLSPQRSNINPISPLALLSPKADFMDKRANRKSVDEVQRMLDEMIQDRVQSGQLIKGKTGSVRVPPRIGVARRHSRRTSSAHAAIVPPLASMIAPIRERDSLQEPSLAV